MVVMRWISDRTTMGKFINTMDFITWIADILNFGLKWTGVTRFFSDQIHTVYASKL